MKKESEICIRRMVASDSDRVEEISKGGEGKYLAYEASCYGDDLKCSTGWVIEIDGIVQGFCGLELSENLGSHTMVSHPSNKEGSVFLDYIEFSSDKYREKYEDFFIAEAIKSRMELDSTCYGAYCIVPNAMASKYLELGFDIINQKSFAVEMFASRAVFLNEKEQENEREEC